MTAALTPDELDAIALFPLPRVVWFPGTRLPLHVFEARYRRMIADCLERGDGDHRRFAPPELRKLQIISDLRESGLSLREIKELMGLKSGHGTATTAACQATTALCAQVDEIERRIQTLQRAREELLSTVATLRTCRECTQPGFPERCGTCSVMTDRGCSRAMHLIWKN